MPLLKEIGSAGSGLAVSGSKAEESKEKNCKASLTYIYVSIALLEAAVSSMHVK